QLLLGPCVGGQGDRAVKELSDPKSPELSPERDPRRRRLARQSVRQDDPLPSRLHVDSLQSVPMHLGSCVTVVTYSMRWLGRSTNRCARRRLVLNPGGWPATAWAAEMRSHGSQ